MTTEPFAARITRSPIAYETEPAGEIADHFNDLSPELREVLAGTAGCSPYLRGLMEKQAEWLRAALSQSPEGAFEEAMQAINGDSDSALRSALRIAKQRVALLTGLADLAGVWSLEQVTGALTDFAGHATDLAMKFQVGQEIRRGKLPGMTEDDIATAGGMVALAMGKMGGHELNYSSDIDLIMLFDDSRFDNLDFHDARASHVKATRRMSAMLSELTADGYVFRTDLRLRPDPSVTPVCVAMQAAERYYESLGRTWERAAHIKARPCGGDLAAGEAYLKRLSPFVWRKHLDFAAIQDAHDMRLRIRAHKGLHGDITLPGHDMKLGRGGIREIEFFTQTRQIIAGGRDETLRSRQTVPGLAALAAANWLPDETAEVLTRHYRFHREVEHRVQMFRDAQTHKLPSNPEEFDRLARMMGEGDTEALKSRIHDALTEVHEVTEGFFAPDDTGASVPQLEESEAEIVSRWETYSCLRSSRAVEIFNRLKPDLLARLAAAPRPHDAMIQFDGFLSRLPAGVQLFSLFEANPTLVDLIVDIAATAPALAAYLGHNAQVLDAVIGGGFFEPWPGEAALTGMLKDRLSKAPDYEVKLDTTRRWMKEWHFRIGVHFLRGLIHAREAGAQYTDLADAVIRALWPEVVANFAVKHGPPPGKGAVLVGMGSLGARSLSATSDLDLIVIYDADGQDMSDGKRPLATKPYYARLTQAFVTAVSAPMAEGKLYEIDMRLRPSGRQGPVATSIDSFRTYQRDEAWTWEHLALTRARVVTGPADVAAAYEAVRQDVLSFDRDPAKVVQDVIDMRARIAAAKGEGGGALEAKLGVGHLQDVELVAQSASLLSPDMARTPREQIAQGVAIGWFTDAQGQAMADSHDLMWRLQAASKLLSDGPLDLQALGQGGQDLLLRETGVEDEGELVSEVETRAARAAEAIEEVLSHPPVVAGSVSA
ncbi:[protein-PII] uridylyltransferase family protein [Aliiroseovarius crassostreae]|uniref:[protein-PII] uridylyltransferase family protein n=1 Tax=Aliiroseovarius crassostreae TaxID=154981 RepID=UPI0021FD8CF4|nr:glutamine-synthetase adenylyltransferase [Aliiroseovarius crassostreae]UWP99933.1 glutamine-synthetase adenylyltransferase [Aliiroseovarius crassostreae]